jgi:hypothetical protein
MVRYSQHDAMTRNPRRRQGKRAAETKSFSSKDLIINEKRAAAKNPAQKY